MIGTYEQSLLGCTSNRVRVSIALTGSHTHAQFGPKLTPAPISANLDCNNTISTYSIGAGPIGFQGCCRTHSLLVDSQVEIGALLYLLDDPDSQRQPSYACGPVLALLLHIRYTPADCAGRIVSGEQANTHLRRRQPLSEVCSRSWQVYQ